jgi:ppGpp synthetase/RelA/SpoT-type nucleotidyltranferase
MTHGLAAENAQLLPILERCREEGRAVLVTLLGQIGSSQLVRARIGEARVKSLESIKRKAARNGWSESETLENVTDLVGYRVVCNNIEDAQRIRDAVTGSDRFDHTNEIVQNFIQNPQPTGYRAIHINLTYNVIGTNDATPVKCEIQTRTLAQDTWARLAHHDLYKEGESLPAHIHRSAVRLASLLSVADDIAQDLREEASTRLPAIAPPDDQITPEALSFVYERVSGTGAPDYLVRYVIQRCSEVGLHRLDHLDRTANDAELRRRIAVAYQESTHWELSDEAWFELAVDVASQGIDEAEKRAQQRGREERADIEAIALRETESELPESFEELPEAFALEKGDIDVSLLYSVASMWDAMKRCDLCGAPIIDVDRFVEEALDYYDLDEDPDGALGRWLVDCGVETGDFDNPSLCSYHGWVMRQED